VDAPYLHASASSPSSTEAPSATPEELHGGRRSAGTVTEGWLEEVLTIVRTLAFLSHITAQEMGVKRVKRAESVQKTESGSERRREVRVSGRHEV
jgi:hypothetical protein